MKNIILFIVVITTFKIKSQEVIHWLIHKDSITDCNFIKNAKFVNEEQDGKITEGYTIMFKNDTVTETINNGKYFIKSKMKFVSKCSYEIYVLETNLPSATYLIGKTIYSEILETAQTDNLIKIRTKAAQWIELVFKKIESYD
ncbi:MAG: hypothetical protein U0V72_14695 [Cytophagales bacterium]